MRIQYSPVSFQHSKNRCDLSMVGFGRNVGEREVDWSVSFSYLFCVFFSLKNCPAGWRSTCVAVLKFTLCSNTLWINSSAWTDDLFCRVCTRSEQSCGSSLTFWGGAQIISHRDIQDDPDHKINSKAWDGEEGETEARWREATVREKMIGWSGLLASFIH